MRRQTPKPTKAVAFPGALTRKDVAPGEERWHVQTGNPERGDAYTDFGGRTLRIPSGDDELSKLVRTHELCHVKFSPHMPAWKSQIVFPNLNPETMQVVEEMRTNHLVSLLGGDLDILADGSEKVCGERVPDTTAGWNQAVDFTVATHGGKACRDFIAGLKKSNPDMADMAQKLNRALQAAVRKVDRGSRSRYSSGNVDELNAWGNTAPYSMSFIDPETKEIEAVNLPVGYVTHVPDLCNLVERYKVADPSTEGRMAQSPDGKPAPAPRSDGGGMAQRWTDVVMGPTVLDTGASGIKLGKKRRPSVSGTRVRYTSRLMTDPQKRVFATVKHTNGGVLLMDMSGSMSLSTSDLDTLLNTARGVTVLGYSGNQPGEPSLWLLAKDGKRVSELPDVPGGNEVDGTALIYAQSIRKNGEPLIWVTDFGVGGRNNEGPWAQAWCAKFVLANRVYQVRDIGEAISALRSSAGSLNKAHIDSRSRQRGGVRAVLETVSS